MRTLVGAALVAYYVGVALVFIYRAGGGRTLTYTPGEMLASALITCPLVALSVAYLTWWSV